MPSHPVERAYQVIQKSQSGDIKNPQIGKLLTDLFGECVKFLDGSGRVTLTSKVPGKNYFAFEGEEKISRPVNQALYLPDVSGWNDLLQRLAKGNWKGADATEITQAVYSVAISFCASIDLLKRGDQKTPGTFFEYLIGHLFASRLGVNPRTRLPVLNVDDLKTELPTDFVFDLGKGKPKFHLPVKTSTRERLIQVWAHQRVLNGVYGTGLFLGTPVILTETKNDVAKREVVEICLPDQWRLYQMHIAQLKRIYYLDVPATYTALNQVFPPLHVRPFGEFFSEADTLS
jgi:hypothetical protein